MSARAKSRQAADASPTLRAAGATTGSILAGLDARQHAAVTTEASPLAILAGPGSGKTRVLTRRIAHRIATGSAAADHVLALTFTRRAAAEMRERLLAMGSADRVVVGTFHAIALASLRQRWSDRGERPRAVLEHKRPVLLRVLAARGIPPAEVPGVASEIEWAKARTSSPEAYATTALLAGRRTALPHELIADIYTDYEAYLARSGLADLDDLLLLAATALRHDASFADAQRWRFRHFFVDEFQDVNPAQVSLLDAWVGGRDDLCVVGDPDQAIYGWNGADPTAITRFATRYRGATVLRLEANYRCPSSVAAVARSALGRPPSAVDTPADDSSLLPAIHAFTGAETEAAGIASLLRSRRGERSWGDMAVLVRTNSQAVALAAHFESVGIPCRVRSHALTVLGERRTSHGDCVEVATFHKAKGLEWPLVVVAGIEDGLVPIGHARTSAELAEERRLLHVALSRSSCELHCTWAERRRSAGRTVLRSPSPWLADIERAIETASLSGARPGPRPADAGEGWRRRVEEARDMLAAASQ